MKKKIKQNKHKSAADTQDTTYQASLRKKLSFSFLHILLALLIGAAIGGYLGYEVARTRIQLTEGGGVQDAYGRSLGHPHYGHTHP